MTHSIPYVHDMLLPVPLLDHVHGTSRWVSYHDVDRWMSCCCCVCVCVSVCVSVSDGRWKCG